MKKDYIGFLTGKVHDTNNYNFSQISNFVIISRIECYYSDEEGIYGFFAFYKNDNLNEKILNVEDSFYKEFKKNFLVKLEKNSLNAGDKLITENIEFKRGELIESIVGVYDEDKKKFNALKITTNRKNYKFGKLNDLKEKGLVKSLHKDNNLITGFKTCYRTEKNDECYLSYIKVYYENQLNFEKYYNNYESDNFTSFFSKKMEWWVKIFTIISKIIFWIIVITFPFLFYYYKSQNIFGGELSIPEEWGGLDKPVKILTDSNGFYHIKANSKKDGYFAIGFLHAKDRLWQMDFNRRVGRGKLSEIFGLKSLPIDSFIRSIGLNEMSLRFESDIKANFKYIREIQSYIDGINYYANNFILPVEYQLMNIKWEDWLLADTLGLFNLFTLTLNHDWNMEIWYKMMEENLGREFADLVISFRDVDYPFWNETIVNDDELVQLNLHKYRKQSDEYLKIERGKNQEKKINKEKETKKEVNNEVKQKTQKIENTPKEDHVLKSELNYSESKNEKNQKPHPIEESITEMLSDAFNHQSASNSWAISGKFTNSGFPHLASDPHLSNSVPSIFYQIKLYLPENTLVASTIPGNPLVLIGSNKKISWGLTTENSDTVDICEEQIEDDYYIYDNQKIKITVTKETIFIKNSDPQTVEVKWTRNGPLFTNELPKQLVAINLNYKADTPISLRLPFYYFHNTNLEFFYALNFAEKPSDFLEQANKLISPNLNLVYATTEGEIGWTPLGLFPIKNYKNRFCRGYTKEDDIIKYVKRAELPHLINPSKGFIVTANNKFAHFNYTYSLHGFHNHVRAYRIREMIEKKLNSNQKFEIKDSIDIAADLKEALAAEILPKLLKIISRNSPAGSFPKYFKELSEWDHIMTKDSQIPTIWSVLELNIGMKLLTNKVTEYTARGLMSILHYWNFISAIIDKIHVGERIDLKQCAHTTGNMNCENYLVFIFNNLDKYLEEGALKDKYGRIYNWGELKFNHYPHPPFDIFPVVNRIFSRDVYTGGNRNTVKIARGPFNHDKGQFISTHSPRMRLICDMKEPIRPYVMLDLGNSGSVLSKFYDNLMDKSENTEYVQIEDVNFENILTYSENVLILK